MVIRKLFKFEGSHVVRNCSSTRCSRSIHGHSYKVEVFLENMGNSLDGGQMVVDFGLLKRHIGALIDAFDHTHVIWNQEEDSYKNFFKDENERWIELPCNPTAEMLSVTFYKLIDSILNATQFSNEETVALKAVRVHETDTGWAEADRQDAFIWIDLDEVKFSPEILKELPSELRELILGKSVQFAPEKAPYRKIKTFKK